MREGWVSVEGLAGGGECGRIGRALSTDVGPSSLFSVE